MRLILSPILEWIRRARRHVQTLLVLYLVTISALDRKDALPVSATTQAERGVWATVLALQRRIACWVTIDAPRMAEDFERLQKSRSRGCIITRLRSEKGTARK
jgi:hypothetical protein